MAKEKKVEEEEPNFSYCESCGIEFKKPEDHGAGDESNTWCKDCCHEDGSHKTKEEVIDVVINIIQGPIAPTAMGETIKDSEEAKELALEYMKKMPAWEEKKEGDEDED